MMVTENRIADCSEKKNVIYPVLFTSSSLKASVVPFRHIKHLFKGQGFFFSWQIRKRICVKTFKAGL